MTWFATKLRYLADRIDPDGAFRFATMFSFTIERGKGFVLREDGKGCPIAYWGPMYKRAHEEADNPM